MANFSKQSEFWKRSIARWISVHLLVFSSAFATDYAPWFPPLFEFQNRTSFLYDHVRQVQSPKGSFNYLADDYSAHYSLGVTPFPYWNVEFELYSTETNNVSFSYEAALLTFRYLWYDDIAGDPVSLATGMTVSFPSRSFLHNFNYAYHGKINGELHTAIGKEWLINPVLTTRIWGFAGLGLANRGKPWVHGLLVWETQKCDFSFGTFVEGLYGFGDQSILENEPFEGYGLINHQNIDLGAYASYQLCQFGTFMALGWMNAYAHNYVEHSWGIAIGLLIPFSF